jgi:multidrug resistance efflux pump
VSRAGTRIGQAWKQYKSQHPDARNNLSDGGLMMSIRQIIRQGSSPELQAKAKEDISKYRATLEPVLAMFERELTRQTELANERQKLFERGVLSESELRAGQRALAAAQKDVDDTRRDIKAADQMKTEGDSRPLPRHDG